MLKHPAFAGFISWVAFQKLQITHIAAMVGIPGISPKGGFPQLQAFSNGAFSFILIVIMSLLTVQVVLTTKMKCLARGAADFGTP